MTYWLQNADATNELKVIWMSANTGFSSVPKKLFFKFNKTQAPVAPLPLPIPSSFVTPSLAAAENKIFHMVTLILHEI